MSTTSRRFLAGAPEGCVEVILSDTWFERDTSRPGNGFSQSPADKSREEGVLIQMHRKDMRILWPHLM